ncbi:gluconate:H+ symporter [Caldanaerobius polysaccharolyticus]|uniref:gluconate:H+ symporter n=1 Tax=Caldanaerobius polysaccharolyticus TaxID=44256 RepID=UPI00047DEC00|nr:gluconate:H+ symporter [Caldanaerobius polysaccharolyticus]
MPIVVIVLGVVLLLILMMGFKLNGFLSLIIVSLAVGIGEGIPITKVIASIENGMGSTLGSLALVVGLGAILGKLMAEGGGAQKIANTLINKFGRKNVQIAIVVTGFIVGIALFYEVGLVLLIPLVFTLAATADIPLIYIGLPMTAALSVTHGFLPPHPGATAVVSVYKADIGLTLLYGILVGIPVVILAGPVFATYAKRFSRGVPENLYKAQAYKEEELPGFWISLFTALIPVILMALATVAKLTLPENSNIRSVLSFIGDPVMALLIAVIIAIFTFGLNRGKKINEVMKIAEAAISSIAMILLIIGGGGAFKQVLIDSGVGKYIADVVKQSNFSPLFLAWLIAAALRIAQGSATVAAITAAGIMAPIVAASNIRPELMVLATGAGSLIFSHVNDPGFWMFKEFFNLTIGETFATWSIMETIISVAGLIGVLFLNMLI